MKRQTGPQDSSSDNEQLEIRGGGSSGGGTVTQGPAGTEPWLVTLDSPVPLPVEVIESVVPGISIPKWDYMERSVVSDTETYEFYLGGSSGTLVSTVTVVYTDATLEELVSVERT